MKFCFFNILALTIFLLFSNCKSEVTESWPTTDSSHSCSATSTMASGGNSAGGSYSTSSVGGSTSCSTGGNGGTGGNLGGMGGMATASSSGVGGSGGAKGPAAVSLGTAGNFVILAKAGIDTVPTSAVTGNIGVSPIDSTAITGFSLTMDSTNTFSTSSQLVGKAFAADYTPPTPSDLTTAVSDMETAFTDAAGRSNPDFTELGAGDISGLTLVPGLYKWGTGVMIASDVTLSGGPNDTWIFQISGDITQASGVKILLAGGALPKNIFWQSYGYVGLGTTSHFEGILLSLTKITLATGATVNGRLFAQTAVTLDGCTVTQPL